VQRIRLILPAVFPGVLLAVTWGCIALSRSGDAVAAVWPVNAIILAFLVRWSRGARERAWVLAMAAAVMIAANLIGGSPPALALALSGLNIVEVAVAAWLLGAKSNPVANLKSFSAFILGPVLIAPALSGGAAAIVVSVLQPGTEILATFVRWFFADSLGVAIVGSFLLTVGRPFEGRPAPRELLIFAGGQLALAVAAIAIFFLAPTPPLFLIFPFLVAATMSHRHLGGVTAVLITSIIALAATFTGRGPAAIAALTGFGQIQLMQVFLAAMTFAVLPISALLQRLEAHAAAGDEARRRAETLNEIKTRLLAHVSHEIRSPMAGVTTLAELMRDGAFGALTDPQRDSLNQIASSGAVVSALAHDLTDAAALQTGKATVNVTRVNVADAIEAAVAMARPRTDQYRATVEVDADMALHLDVAADPLRLRQILVNLLVNGAKYGGKPARVWIGVRAVGADGVRFEVRDNGAGVPPEDRVRLFQDFDRLGAEKSDLDGAGLGLALSQQIARLQDGLLGVDDVEGGGARFWLDLPRWRQRSAA
jgi:signal transduction histidine kinase